MREFVYPRWIALFLLVFSFTALSGCYNSNGDDDDSDDDFGDGGNGGGGGDDDNSGATCDRVMAFGTGLAEMNQGSWADATPDLFSSRWKIADAAKIDCDQFLYVGRDDATRTGLVLAGVEHAYAQELIPTFSTDWELTAVDSKKGAVIAVGGDWQGGKGVAFTRIKGNWTIVELPYVSANWWLTDIVLTSSDKGYAIGADFQNVEPVLLKLEDGVWTQEPSPGAGGGYFLYGIQLSDAKNGLAVGSNQELGKGAVVRLSNGTWYSATAPDVSEDWDLKDAALSSDQFGILAGRGFDTGMGVALSYSEGLLAVLTLPFVSSDWSLSGVTAYNSDFLACGADGEHGEGVILRYASDVWTIDARFPFELRGIRSF